MARIAVKTDIYSKGISVKGPGREMSQEVQVVDDGNFFTKKVSYLTSCILLSVIFILSVGYGIFLGRKKMRKYR